MPVVTANGIEICYEEFGSATDPAVLLIAGLGGQLIAWPPDFCRLLAAEGFRVIRFDNRDAGLSAKTTGALPEIVVRDAPADDERPLGLVGEAPYGFRDMAADGVGLLSALGIDAAHVVGASLGGMIGQRMAISFPDRVLSLTSMMSSTGNPAVGRPTAEASAEMFTQVPPERDAIIGQAVKVARLVSGPLFDQAQAETAAAEAYDRMYYPQGALFYFAALIADGDRTDDLRAIRVPTVVIHGRADALVAVSGGEATAAAVHDSTFVVHEDMGHNLPRQLWPDIISSIARNASRTKAI